MQCDTAAYDKGVVEARRDAAVGRLRFYSGAPSHGWGRDLAESLHARFGIEVSFTSCLVTVESVSFENGYNAAIEEIVDDRWGRGSLAEALAHVQERRKLAYDAWVARMHGEPGNARNNHSS